MTSWSRARLVATLGVAALAAGCGSSLSAHEEQEYDRILVRLEAVCAHAPISGASEREATTLVNRAITLTSKAPDHSWTIDPEDRDTGDQYTGTALIRVSEILNGRPGRHTPRCSSRLRARAEQAIAELELLK